MKRRVNKKKVTFYILGICAVVIVLTISCIQISNYSKKNEELRQRKERLDALLENEKLRQESLEDEAVYVRTKEFIEDKARSIGYVYPDEIIFKKSN